jgi:hypothetical protein
MPFTSTTVTGDSLRTEVIETIAVDTGRLTSASAINLQPDAEFVSTYVQIGIMTAETDRQHIVTVLAQGYCDSMNAVAWSGNIGLEPEMLLYVKVWSSISAPVKLTISTDQ